MNLIEEYLDYRKHTESHAIYHRWTMMTSIGALLGRSIYFENGPIRIFPNLYVMLIGEAASRKSTAINFARKVTSAAGYKTFAATKTSKEKFLMDLENPLSEEEATGKDILSITEKQLFGDNEKFSEPKEVFIVADEFNIFAGTGNTEFYDELGTLWDWDNEHITYSYRLKNSKSVSIFQPTVSLLSGNTQEGFFKAFPPEVLESGFLSRLIIVHGVKSGRRIAFLPKVNQEETERMQQFLKNIKPQGDPLSIEMTVGARTIATAIYDEPSLFLRDIRFDKYMGRRQAHLFKLCLIVMAATYKTKIDEEIVIYANTVLAAAEINMPTALGEFGKAKNSDINNKIINELNNATGPVSVQALWKAVGINNLGEIGDLVKILQALQHAEKVQQIKGGFLPWKEAFRERKYVDWTLLTQEEKDML